MHTFRIWAPRPKKLEIQVGKDRFPMTAEARGWWTADVAAAGAGSDYGFVVDGEGPFPDPRSLSQPNGVHGLSRVVDHGAFQWTDSHWQPPPLSSAVIYELHIGTFTHQGTFESAIEKLDHLAQLGVTHVEVMPVNEFDGMHGWGYDGVGLYAPHRAYGEPDGLKKLVDACHARGLAVLLDVVYNHFGPVGNYLGKFAPYLASTHHSPWGDAVNFDGPGSDEVRRFFCDNARMWLRDYHFDGLRLDAVHAIFDTSAVPFLEQLAAEVKQLQAQLGRHLVLIAESDLNDPRLLWPRERGGFNLDAQWSDDFHHALHTVLTGERSGHFVDFGKLADLAKALRQAFVIDGGYSTYRRRHHGRLPEGLDGDRFVVCLQNHDQTGNRPLGDRSSHLMSPGRMKMGALILFTSPFVPLLFQGEEWGASTPFLFFTDHQEPELAQAIREGRHREYAALGWAGKDLPDPQARETFERSKLNWLELSRESHAGMLRWHRELIRLRHAEPALNDGQLHGIQTHFDEQERWLVIERGDITIACNFSNSPKQLPLPAGKHRILLTSDTSADIAGNSVNLTPESAAVLKQEE